MGSISVRNAASALKSGTALKMRDAAGALKTVSTIKMRDAANVLKTAFDVGGGGGGGAASVNVTPASKSTNSDTLNNNTSSFTASFSSAPSSIVWSIQSVSGGTATIVSGQGTATASIKLTNTGAAGTTASCTVKCTAVIGGVSVNDTATKTHKINAAVVGGGTVSITNRNLVRTSLHGTTTAQYNLNADGKVYGPSPAAIVETWLTSGAASSFEARATLQSGVLASGTTGTWLPLSTTRSWTSVSCQLLIEIRPAGGGATLDSATIILSTDIIETG